MIYIYIYNIRARYELINNIVTCGDLFLVSILRTEYELLHSY